MIIDYQSCSFNLVLGKYFQDEQKRVFWTQCATPCLDLMLEDIRKLPESRGRGKFLVGLTYNQSFPLHDKEVHPKKWNWLRVELGC